MSEKHLCEKEVPRCQCNKCKNDGRGCCYRHLDHDCGDETGCPDFRAKGKTV